MIIRHYRLERLDALDEIWDDFETWFADIEETHTSQPTFQGYYDGHKDTFLATDTSSKAQAAAMVAYDASQAEATNQFVDLATGAVTPPQSAQK